MSLTAQRAAVPSAPRASLPGVAQGWIAERGRVEPLSSLEPRPLSSGVTAAICTLSRPDSVRQCLESIAGQTRPPDQVVIVDASAGDATENAVRAAAQAWRSVSPIVYVRVDSSRSGLTRQRNLALALTNRRLVGFFDDDVTLGPECLAELERAHRDGGAKVAGVGARVEREEDGPRLVWRVRRLLRVVPSLEPGRYCRSGMSTPWSLVRQEDGVLEGDWLPGYAMMWQTSLARELQFDEGLAGYAQSEDLEFSLRAGRRGKILLACAARVADAHAPAGRPDAFRMGYMAIYNRFLVHRRGLADRTGRDVAWFAYAWTIDTLLLARHLVHPRRFRATLSQVGGRMTAAIHLLAGR